MECSQPYSLFQGETRKPLFTATKPNGDIQNLAGAVIECQVKPKIGDPDSELLISKLSPAAGIIILDQTVGGDTEGQFLVCFDTADTVGIDPGVYAWDVVIVLDGTARSYAVNPSPFIIKSVVNPA